ncbi:predicted protein [Chaetoceros tenuissimus]|uniref:Uncharacterized protein n=1 Tax=Chaetoceros tenuissimus TaxID=426638 RepID=A0AAD3GYF4_9STRA|nr:predicted protein [Chaetoceros tenuissimus]
MHPAPGFCEKGKSPRLVKEEGKCCPIFKCISEKPSPPDKSSPKSKPTPTAPSKKTKSLLSKGTYTKRACSHGTFEEVTKSNTPLPKAPTPKKPKTPSHNIFDHETFDDLCEETRSYKFKLKNGKMRRCSYITKKDTKARQDMYCKGETAKEWCKACKVKKCEDKSDFRFKLKNGKSTTCSYFKKGKASKRKAKYCTGKVKKKCCEACA